MDPLRSLHEEQKKWEKSMSIGDEDTLLSILSGEKIDFDKRDYLNVEPEEHHISEDSLLEKFASIEKVDVPKHSDIQNDLSEAQLKAIKQYPNLIEMLGSVDDDDFPDKIAQIVNNWIIERIGKNSSIINKNAIETKQEDGFIKQYFKYDDKVGFVKVSGQFTGNEFIHHTEDESLVLLRIDKEDFKNISDKFEIESHFVEIEE